MASQAATREMARVALFAALVAVLGLLPPIPVPVIPVPITAQTLGVMLAGALLGAKRGGQALLLFLIVVAIGMPVLSGGRGGLGVFFGPSGGFIVAFPFGAWVVGWLTERMKSKPSILIGTLINIIGGIGVLYAVGVPWMAVVADLTLTQAAVAAAAFIPGDLIKAIVAAVVADAVRRGYPLLNK